MCTLSTRSTLLLFVIACKLNFIASTTTTTIEAFDLSKDPYESTTIATDSSYTSQIVSIVDKAKYYKDLVVSADSTYFGSSYQVTRNDAFDSCGGLCVFADDDDYTIEAIDVLYNEDTSTTNPPNVVFVLVDDWGYNDVSYHSDYMSWTTPNIDKLSQNGIIIENYYTEPSCGPARSSLMTGRYAFRTGMQVSKTSKSEGDAELPVNETTIAQEFKSANYKTYMIGKWDIGYSSVARTPHGRGFDYFYGYFSASIDYYTKKTTYSQDGSTRTDLQNNGTLEEDADYYLEDDDHHSAYIFQHKAEAILESHASTYSKSTPFFLYYALQLVHYPSTAPARFIERCASQSLNNDDLTSTTNSTLIADSYCARVLMLDEVIGNLTCSLESNGLMDNTILIIAGDNGGYELNYGTSYPYRGYKWDYSEGGIRTNAMVYSPLFDDSLKGTTYNGTFHVTDWLPTLMNLATSGEWSGSYSGAALDGVDQTDALEGSGNEPRNEIVTYINSVGTEYSIIVNNIKVTTENISSIDVGEPTKVFEEDLDSYHSYTQTCSLDSGSIIIEPSSDYSASLFGLSALSDESSASFSLAREGLLVLLKSSWSPYLYFILLFAIMVSLSVIAVTKSRVDRLIKSDAASFDSNSEAVICVAKQIPSYNSLDDDAV